MLLTARQFHFQFPRPALIVGILNVTPDSFSDGGRFMDVPMAVDRAYEMATQGADIIDLGGESTRPNAVPVPEAEELRRVIPVLDKLVGKLEVPISIDTMKPAVAREALAAGAAIVNDVGASRVDEEMWRLVAQSGAGYACMHMRGTPQTMQANLEYEDVVREVGEFFSERIQRLGHCGITAGQVIIDPGIGFGKGLNHNLQLLGGLREFARFARPLMIGVSRKSFIEKLLGSRAGDRGAASLACACLAVSAGAQLLRVHDVAETLQAIRMAEAILANSH